MPNRLQVQQTAALLVVSHDPSTSTPSERLICWSEDLWPQRRAAVGRMAIRWLLVAAEERDRAAQSPTVRRPVHSNLCDSGPLIAVGSGAALVSIRLTTDGATSPSSSESGSRIAVAVCGAATAHPSEQSDQSRVIRQRCSAAARSSRRRLLAASSVRLGRV